MLVNYFFHAIIEASTERECILQREEVLEIKFAKAAAMKVSAGKQLDEGKVHATCNMTTIKKRKQRIAKVSKKLQKYRHRTPASSILHSPLLQRAQSIQTMNSGHFLNIFW